MAERTLPIRTVFYMDHRAKEHARTIASGNPLRAAGNALVHLRKGKWNAALAEVYHDDTGKLYAVLKKDLHGQVHTLFQAKLKPEEMEA